MKIAHCITGLDGDGAQRMLLRLATGLREHGVTSEVISLGHRTPVAALFEERGISVVSLQLSPRLGDFMRGVVRVRQIVSANSFDLVQSWMYHANTAASCALQSIRRDIPLVWNIRRGLDDYHQRGRLTRSVIRSNALISRLPQRIIYCSAQSRQQHEAIGFCRLRSSVVENGFDAQRFRPDADRRRAFRQRYGFSDEDYVIGNVGRFDVAKGHAYLVRAFIELSRVVPNARLVLVGRNVDESNSEIAEPLREAGLLSSVRLLGEQSAIEEIYPGFDLYCQASLNEGFPNALAESMACGVPCVATDTGASRDLVHGIGCVVQGRSPELLAEAVCAAARRSAAERVSAARSSRARVVEKYSLERIVQEYLALYRELQSARSYMEFSKSP